MRLDKGMRLKAFVVADGSIAEEALRAPILAWLAENMNAASRPVDFALRSAAAAQCARQARGLVNQGPLLHN